MEFIGIIFDIVKPFFMVRYVNKFVIITNSHEAWCVYSFAMIFTKNGSTGQFAAGLKAGNQADTRQIIWQ